MSNEPGLQAEALYSDTRLHAHHFKHIRDTDGDMYIWETQERSVAMLRGMSMDFGIWAAECIKGIELAFAVADPR
jgi:hypothetical protein